jgi:type VI secretion system ImpH/TssG family protein
MKYKGLNNHNFGKTDIMFKSRIDSQSKYYDIHKITKLAFGRIEIHVSFIGLAGIEGSLPDVIVEKFLHSDFKTRKAVESLLYILNHKILSIWYLASKKYNPHCCSCDVSQSTIGNIIASLSCSKKNMVEESLIHEQFTLSIQELLWRINRSAHGLKIILEDFFDISVTIEQFVGSFTNAEEKLQTTLGTRIYQYNKLGFNSFIGNKVWNQTSGINIHINNITLNRYRDFVPKISKRDHKPSVLGKMESIIKTYIFEDIKVSIVFHIIEDTKTLLYLNRTNRLGMDSFIPSKSIKESTYKIQIM